MNKRTRCAVTWCASIEGTIQACILDLLITLLKSDNCFVVLTEERGKSQMVNEMEQLHYLQMTRKQPGESDQLQEALAGPCRKWMQSSSSRNIFVFTNLRFPFQTYTSLQRIFKGRSIWNLRHSLNSTSHQVSSSNT